MLNIESYVLQAHWLYYLALPYLTFSLGCTSSHPPENSLARPNILLVLTDDQGYKTIGSYGGEHVHTPHLDQLAARGMRFTDAYVTSQCTPTRASLLTGQYTARNGMWHVIGWYGYPWARMREPAYVENLSRETYTLPKGLQQAEYRTAIVGKWHLTTNEDGHYMGLNPQAAHHYGFDFAPPVIDRAVFNDGGDRGVYDLTEQALGFIGANKDQPWFCLLSHHMIHGKVVAPDSLVNKYRKLGYGEEGPYRAVYLAGLELIDWSVGRLVAGLEQLGEFEETMIVFISDNGGIDERLDWRTVTYDRPEGFQFDVDIREYDNAPLRAGKGSIYEGGVRVPMIVHWPEVIKKASVVSDPVHIIDLVPTFLELAGTEPAHPLDGTSLVPLFRKAPMAPLAERPIFQYCPFYDLNWGLTPCASIRLGDYKLIEFYGDQIDAHHHYSIGNRIELYNLKNDIGETTDLSQTQPEIAKSLSEKLDAWLEKMGADTPTLNERYDPKRAFESTREKPAWLK